MTYIFWHEVGVLAEAVTRALYLDDDGIAAYLAPFGIAAARCQDRPDGSYRCLETPRSNNEVHRPVTRALELVRRYADTKLRVFPMDEDVPLDGIDGLRLGLQALRRLGPEPDDTMARPLRPRSPW